MPGKGNSRAADHQLIVMEFQNLIYHFLSAQLAVSPINKRSSFTMSKPSAENRLNPRAIEMPLLLRPHKSRPNSISKGGSTMRCMIIVKATRDSEGGKNAEPGVAGRNGCFSRKIGPNWRVARRCRSGKRRGKIVAPPQTRQCMLPASTRMSQGGTS